MARIHGRKVWLLVLGAALLGGCGKQVSLSFFNLTSDTIGVYVTTPTEGRHEVGLVPPMGRLEHTISIPENQLPATCSWQTGSVSRSFQVTKDTPDQDVTIMPTGAPKMQGRDSSIKDEFDKEMSPVTSGPPSSSKSSLPPASTE